MSWVLATLKDGWLESSLRNAAQSVHATLGILSRPSQRDQDAA